ncbi:MAG: hypothetical protein Q8J89_09955 [Caulobacter sp.]|nr:hypothetical protein [Caulobacter sp.]
MRARLYGLGRPLALMALLVAAADAILFPIALFTDALSDDRLQRALYASAFTLAVVFLRAVLDPAVQRAVLAANHGLQEGQPFKPRWISPMDPTWGAFGSRMGQGVLPWLRLVLLGEFALGLILLGTSRTPPPVLLAAVGLGLCILLSMTQLKDHYGSEAEAADKD